MIDIYIKTEKDSEFIPISEYQQGCFIYAKQASLEDLEKIDELLSHEIGDIHGSIDKYEIPRVEKHNENLLLFTRHPGAEEAGLHTEPLTLILTKNYLIAISPYSNPLIDHLLLMPSDVTTIHQPSFLLYLLMRISHQFTTSIKQVRHSILLYEQSVWTIENNAIISLTKNEETLNQYLTALVSMRNLLETLTAHRYLNLNETDQEMLQETLIGIGQSEELCRVNVKSIRSLRDSYQIIFTNDVSKVIKRLTAITIILSLPTMVASIYGMNMAIPLQNYPHLFAIVIGFAAVSSLFATIIFIKNRWL